ncbi:MAG: HIT family protein [Bdellovibrionales bacterium]
MSTLFTKIILQQIPSYKIFEDDWTYSFLTKDQIQLGHTLIVPKIEADHFIDVGEPFYSKVFQNALMISRAIYKATNCTRVGTIIAGWEVPHFHYHLVPMFSPADLDFAKGKERSREENILIQTKIVEQIHQQFKK